VTTATKDVVRMSDEVTALLDQPVLYNLATVNPNGTIQLNPVWGEVHEGMSASTPSPVAASTRT